MAPQYCAHTCHTRIWDLNESNLSYPESSKITCRKILGYCFEARAFQANQHLFVEPFLWRIIAWTPREIRAEEDDQSICLYIDRENKSVFHFSQPNNHHGCSDPDETEKFYLKDWYEINTPAGRK